MLGPVFLARDADRRSFAVKVFRLDITPEQAAELGRQLAALSRANLEHPSIAAPVTAGVEGTVAYLVEEYVGADSLDAAIRQYGPAPLGQALKILTNVAAALDFAGAVNVHHGALHPRDLLVTPDQVRVTGFGVAAALETIGLRAPIRRPYTAPERIQREAWDGRADVYSLGVLAREMILRRGVRPDADAAISDAVGARVEDVVTRATAARVSERFATALDLVRSLQDAVTPPESAATSAKAGSRSLRSPRGRGLLLPLEEEAAETRGEDAAPAPSPATSGEAAREVVPLPEEISLESAHAAVESDITDLPLNHLAAAGDVEQQPIEEPPPMAEPLPPFVEDRFTDVFEGEHRPGAERQVEPEFEPAGESAAPLAHETLEAPIHDDRSAIVTADPTTAFAQEGPAIHRTGVLPFVAVLVVGLIIGIIGGYFWGASRNIATSAPPAGSQQPGAVGSGAGQPAASSAAAQQSATPTPAQQSATSATAATRPQSAPPPSSPATNPPAAKPATPNPSATKAAPSTATPRVKGRLVINSSPSGAAVLVNGRRRGITPLRLSNVPAGRYTVRLTRSGYAPEERDVVISADRPSSTLALTLKRGASAEPAGRTAYVGSLAIDSTPPGAKVFLDGKLVGTTPCVVPDVAIGSHVVRVDMIGYSRWAQSVEVKANSRLRVTAALEREGQ